MRRNTRIITSARKTVLKVCMSYMVTVNRVDMTTIVGENTGGWGHTRASELSQRGDGDPPLTN